MKTAIMTSSKNALMWMGMSMMPAARAIVSASSATNMSTATKRSFHGARKKLVVRLARKSLRKRMSATKTMTRL